MMVRWLVANFIRQTARQKISEAAAGAAKADAGGASGQPSPLPPCEIAFVFSLAIESDGLVTMLDPRVTTRCASYLEHAGRLEQRSVVGAETGLGARAAENATEDILAVHHPAWIVCAGFAGALDPQLRRGDILMAEHVADLHGNKLSIGFKMDPRSAETIPGLRLGTLLSVDGLIRAPSERRRLGEQHGAAACDMETMAVARICRRRKVRFLSVRVITDALDDRLPVEVERLLAQKTIAGKLGAATGAVFKRPSSIKDMWRVREQALKASDRLAKFLGGVAPQLADAAAP